MKHCILIFLCVAFGFTKAQYNFNKGKVGAKNYFEEIPVEFNNNLIFINVEIKGETYRFLLDTGAVNLISKELQEKLNYEVLDKIKISDSNDRTSRLEVVKQDELKLGNLKFKNIPAVVYDFNSIPVFACMDIHGFIGSNMLRNSIIQFNKTEETVTLTDNLNRLTSIDKNNAEKLILKKRQSAPNIWVKYKNKTQEILLIDTGFTGLYSLKEENFKYLKERNELNVLQKGKGLGSVGLYGLGESYNQYLIQVPELNINGFKIENHYSSTSNDDKSKIGAKLLDYGVMTLDFRKKKFYFNPYKESSEKLNSKQHSVEFIFSGNKMVVANIWDESLQNKIQLGDELLEIDNVPIDICLITKQMKKDSFIAKIKTKNNEIFEIKIEQIFTNN